MELPFNYDSFREISAFMDARGLSLNKRFGQNFLINRGAREKILKILGSGAGERVWEIGPGIGAMTAMLLDRGVDLTVFEIDRGFIRILKELFADRPFQVIEGDVLHTWKEARARLNDPDRIMGNLPYNSASAIILDLIRENVRCRNMVFTVQKEAAQRMAAEPGSPSYSSFSIICRFSHQVILHGDLQPGSFYPSPDVTSSIVEFVPSSGRPAPQDRTLFFSFVQSLFSARRKTIRNNLSTWAKTRAIEMNIVLEALEEVGIDPSARGETISPERVVSLSNSIVERIRA